MLIGLLAQQLSVYYGIARTFERGQHHTANITDFRIKQIAAQTNGYVDLQFVDEAGNDVRQRLTLHVQHASRLIGQNQVEIRYLPDTAYDIVITKTYEYHRNTVRVNMSVIGLSLLVLFPICIWASRFAIRRNIDAKEGRYEPELEYLNKPA